MELQNSSTDQQIETEKIVQFLSVKKVGNAGERYRLIISDGEYFIQAMLATQCNSLVDSETLTRFSVTAIERATCNLVQGKR
jgi:replication factor A1